MIDSNALSEILAGLKGNTFDEPKYRRLQMAISHAISSGSLQTGQRLPTDKAFAELLSVSLGTVQKALINLKEIGVVTRTPKRGTIVADHVVHKDDIYVFRFRDPQTKALIPPEVRMLSMEEVECDGSLHDFFQCERAIRFKRMLRVGMEPPVYSEIFVFFEMAAKWVGRSPEEFPGLSVHRFLHSEHNQPILRTENRLRAGAFDEEARYHLMAEKGAWGMIWDIYGYSYNDLPCTFQRIQLPPEHRPVEFRRSLSDKR